MHCKNCGKYIPDGSSTCNNCGVSVNTKNPTEELLKEIIEEQRQQTKYLKSICTCVAIFTLILLGQVLLTLFVANII